MNTCAVVLMIFTASPGMEKVCFDNMAMCQKQAENFAEFYCPKWAGQFEEEITKWRVCGKPGTSYEEDGTVRRDPDGTAWPWRAWHLSGIRLSPYFNYRLKCFAND